MYDLILENGELIDPSQGIHEVGSVAIQDGRIAAIRKEIQKAEAKEVFNMKGKIITPGLITCTAIPLPGSHFLEFRRMK